MPGGPHWSVSPSGKLLSALTVFIYQKFETSSAEGGWREFFNQNCGSFSIEEDGEQNLECYDLFRRFEVMLEYALEDFAQKEGKSVNEVHQMISEVDDRNSKASKFLKKLLVSFEYSKFAQIMRDRAKTVEDLASDVSSSMASIAHVDNSQIGVGITSNPPSEQKEAGEKADYKDTKEAWK